MDTNFEMTFTDGINNAGLRETGAVQKQRLIKKKLGLLDGALFAFCNAVQLTSGYCQ